MSDPLIDQMEAEIADLKTNVVQGARLGAWWTWTIAQFDDWCNTNLMSDSEIDALASLPVRLRTNLKSNNAFVRNAGKLLVVARDVIKWLIRKI